jgi:hypothetical protein
MGAFLYDVFANQSQTIDRVINSFCEHIADVGLFALHLSLLAAIGVGTGLLWAAHRFVGNQLNNHYRSQLPEESADYLFGQNALRRLSDELVFEDVQKGIMGKRQYLESLGYKLIPKPFS